MAKLLDGLRSLHTGLKRSPFHPIGCLAHSEYFPRLTVCGVTVENGIQSTLSRALDQNVPCLEEPDRQGHNDGWRQHGHQQFQRMCNFVIEVTPQDFDRLGEIVRVDVLRPQSGLF